MAVTATAEAAAQSIKTYRHIVVDGARVKWGSPTPGTGAVVVPILDTPGPPGFDVPACVTANPQQLSACAYPKAVGVESSGAPAQLAAAARVPGARVVDMSATTCPDGVRCPAVIGNVVVYRSGSHLSDTYAATTARALSRELAKATRGRLGRVR